MNLLINTVFILIWTLLVKYDSTMAHSKPSTKNLFALDLFSAILDTNAADNIVFSPLSIYSSLALVYLGAKDQTAEELRRVLKINPRNKLNFAKAFGDLLQVLLRKRDSLAEGPEYVMANRLYVSNGIKILPEFNKIAKANFNCSAEYIDLNQPSAAAKQINDWVEQHTNNKIQNLIQPNALSYNTAAFLVNALYFKAKWLNPFSTVGTKKMDFFISPNEVVQVDTMYNHDLFHYAELPELDAKALGIRYEIPESSRISRREGITLMAYMWIILPNEIGGLKKLESRLREINFADIDSNSVYREVKVLLPKFRVEFDVDLKEPLKRMGCSSLFSTSANLDGIFEETPSQGISGTKHKAVVEINEGGTEAAATTFYSFEPVALSYPPMFMANHPFLFFVRSKTTVFFAGRVTKF